MVAAPLKLCFSGPFLDRVAVSAIDYLSLCWTGANINVGMLVLIYVFSVMLIMLPGIVGALLAGSFMGKTGVPVGMLVLAAWEFVPGLGCFIFFPGILMKSGTPRIF